MTLLWLVKKWLGIFNALSTSAYVTASISESLSLSSLSTAFQTCKTIVLSKRPDVDKCEFVCCDILVCLRSFPKILEDEGLSENSAPLR